MLKSVLKEAAGAGAREILRFFNKSFTVSNKEGVNNLVTEADHAAEKAIIEVIHRHYPDHQVLGEESGASNGTSSIKWIVDPIDGTVNFAHGIPLNCVSIAIEEKGAIIMAAVLNPHEIVYHRLSKIKAVLCCFDYFACPNGIHPGGQFTKIYK